MSLVTPNTVRPTALQLCPFSESLEAGLRERFNVVRWFELSAAQQAGWLEQRAGEARAVVTGGHVGCSVLRGIPAADAYVRAGRCPQLFGCLSGGQPVAHRDGVCIGRRFFLHTKML